MITFRQFYEAATKPSGNYMSIGVDGSLMLPGFVPPKTGTEVTLDKQHVTLIYSKESNTNHGVLLDKIEQSFPTEIAAKVVEFACFDDLPKDGERDENKSTLVVKLKSDLLVKIHEKLKQLGCEHSYPKFSPHVSLYYGVDRDECHRLVAKMNSRVPFPTDVRLSGYVSQPIVKDWGKTLDTK